MGRITIRDFLGRISEPNASLLKPGACMELVNCLIRKRGIIEPLPETVALHGSTAGNTSSMLWLANDYDKGPSNTLAYFKLASGTWTTHGIRHIDDLSLEITYASPDSATASFDMWHSSDNKSYRALEPYVTRDNMYVSDYRGTYKFTDISASPLPTAPETVWEVNAGLSISYAAGVGRWDADSHANYRLVVVYEDENGVIRRSRPTPIVKFDSTSTGLAPDVYPAISLHDANNTSISHIEVYRTRIYPNDISLAQAEMYLVKTWPASELVATPGTGNKRNTNYKTVTNAWADEVPNEELGKLIYTYSEEPNYAPPNALYHATWNGFEFWANGVTPTVWEITTDSDSVENVIVTCTSTTIGSPVISTSSTTGVEVGMIHAGINLTTFPFPPGAYVTGVSAGASITMSENAIANTGSLSHTFLPAALVRYADGKSDRFPLLASTLAANALPDSLVGTNPLEFSSGDAYSTTYFAQGSYIGTNSVYRSHLLIGSIHAPGRHEDHSNPVGLWVNGSTNWTAPNSAAVGNIRLSSGAPTTNGTPPLQSVYVDGLWVSKRQEPEHNTTFAPFARVGKTGSEILGLAALQDALIIVKRDGVYRLTGSDPSRFRIDPIDTSRRYIGGRTVKVINDKVYCLAENGIVTITATAVTDLSAGVVNDFFHKYNKDYGGDPANKTRMGSQLQHMERWGWPNDHTTWAAVDPAHEEYLLCASGVNVAVFWSSSYHGGPDDLLVYSDRTKTFATWRFKTASNTTLANHAVCLKGRGSTSYDQIPGMAFAWHQKPTSTGSAASVQFMSYDPDSLDNSGFEQFIRFRAIDAGSPGRIKLWHNITIHFADISDESGSIANPSDPLLTFIKGEPNYQAIGGAPASNESILLDNKVTRRRRCWPPRSFRRGHEISFELSGWYIYLEGIDIEYVDAGGASEGEVGGT